MTTRILIGDALSQLRELPDESVHCVVTSPPYWGLRAFKGDPGMIGLEPTIDEHLDNLVAVFREVRRVLRSDGTVWLNYGDAYAATTKGLGAASGSWARNKGAAMDDRRATIPPGYKPKDLLMMPARVAMALQADGVADPAALRAIQRATEILIDEYDGSLPDKVQNAVERLDAEYADAKGDSWWLRSEIIWHKPNPMPEPVTDRPTSAHEKLFLLTKSARYFYDAAAVRVPISPNTNNAKGRHFAPPKGIDGEFSSRDTMDRTRTPEEEKANGANLRNVWTIAPHNYSEAHFATFPPALVEPCIKAGTSKKGVCGECGAPWVGTFEKHGTGKMSKNPDGWDTGSGGHGTVHRNGREQGKTTEVTKTVFTGWSPSCACAGPAVPATVLDPFAGTGTVGLVAERLDRDSILIEISADYAAMARNRIEDDAPLLAKVTE